MGVQLKSECWFFLGLKIRQRILEGMSINNFACLVTLVWGKSLFFYKKNLSDCC